MFVPNVQCLVNMILSSAWMDVDKYRYHWRRDDTEIQAAKSWVNLCVLPRKRKSLILGLFSKCLNWSPKSSLSILYKSRCVLASIVCILWSTSIYAGACHKLCLYIRFEVKLSVVTQKSAPSLQISRFALLIKTIPRIKTPIRTSTSSDSLQHKLGVTNNRLNRPCCNMP